MPLRDPLIESFESAWQVLEQTIEDCPEEVRHWRGEGATIGSPVRVYAHAVLAADVLVHEILLGRPTVLELDGWRSAGPVDLPATPLQDEALVDAPEPDLDALRPYAAAVRGAIAEYIGGLSDAALVEVVETPMGPMSVASLVSRFVVWHLGLHTGEIAALVGVRGHRGLPF